MYYKSENVGLIEIKHNPEFNAYCLYIGGELYDYANSVDELRRSVERHDTGCLDWDLVYDDEMPVWVTD